MMDEYWVKIYKYVAITIIVLIIATTSSCQYTKYTLKEMVKDGANPIAAKCALENNNIVLCTNFILSKQK